MIGKVDPLHLAIIPDGNRRWARSRMLLPWKGHEHAVENFRALSDFCRAHPRIAILSLWCFSTENWKRDTEEVNKLMDIYTSYLRHEWRSMQRDGVRLLHSGRTERLPSTLQEILAQAIDGTKDGTNFTLHLAIDYGGRDEVVRALSRMPKSEAVTEESIRGHLDHPELQDIDIILRTSGEQRTSNFFLWQSTYAEWFFVSKHFPELSPADLEMVIDDFLKRQRRFGGG